MYTTDRRDLAGSDFAYLDEVNDRLESLLTRFADRRHRCPECDSDIDPACPDDHVFVGDLVVIGCEGYHIIDPQLLGLPRGNWSPSS